MTIFEVDHPLSQAWKRRRLDELHVALPHHAVFAAVDFDRHTLGDRLIAAGFDFERPAVVSWIGVTMYLTREAIDATLNTIAGCSPGTRLVLSYDQPPNAIDERGELSSLTSPPRQRKWEPFVSLLRTDEVERLLPEHGFTSVAHFTTADAARDYFAGVDIGMPDVQRLATAHAAGKWGGAA